MYFSNNFVSFLIVSGVMLVWVEVMKILAHRNYFSSWTRRKLMHILTGPIFLLFWNIFSPNQQGSYYAATVPLVLTLKFVLVGLGVLTDADTVNSMSRTGDRRELLRGPLLYGLVFVVTTVAFWRSITSVICLFTLCFGDGFAEIIGRSYGRNNRLFWSHEKSWAGMLGFIIISTIATTLFLALFPHIVEESFSIDKGFIFRLISINICAALAESLPLGEFDNIVVFLAATAADRSIFTS